MSIGHRAVYPTQPAPLRQHLHDALEAAAPEPLGGDLIGLIVPDSNRLSGIEAAAEAYALVNPEAVRTVIIVSPSHDGMFDRLSICRTDHYHTPLGVVRIDDALRHELCDEDDDIFLDDSGHYHTEGADVQLPFLQFCLGEKFEAVPIVMGAETIPLCKELGRAVGEVLYGKQALVVGTADVLDTSDAQAAEALRNALETMDETALMGLLGHRGLTVEGLGAAAVTLIAAKRRGATHARLLRLTNPSGDRPGVLVCALYRA